MGITGGKRAFFWGYPGYETSFEADRPASAWLLSKTHTRDYW
ncbi:hypothetical protein HMPREF1862_00957 [Varibaculum cambriense]|uniref:Uncharacterized protein n=1 Tax=Varibaculum cambriense TaxID=184870 RepID=A0AB34WZD1_9ACTO|nr:hypothetical protein HMPREF1862_00957 [Varibaculum cambriense]